MALRSDGKAVGWGYGVNGMLGKGDTADTTAAQAPNGFVLLDETIVDFTMTGTCEGGTLYGANHFLTSDGRVFSVGSGYYYQNGTYANVGTAVPRKIVF
jgi:hypothetical protein